MKYIRKYHNKVQWLEHRYVWTQAHGDIPKGMFIHHINGDGHDNRLSNLRMVTNTENLQMSDCMGKGYSIHKRIKARPYYTQRVVWGKVKYLGYFGTPCGAIMANRMAYVEHN